MIADLLQMPLSKVRVYAPDPGGAFGGKQHAKYEPLLAFMAKSTGRPVRLTLTLEETFQAVRRGAAEVAVRSGFQRDGTLVFRDIKADYLIGAYADIADRTVAKGSYTSGGPYRCPATRIVARSVLSHTVPSTAFRGFGNPQQIWAVESNMDEAARTLGIDPLALRLQNLARPGELFLPDDRPADGDWAKTVGRAAEMIGWGTPPPSGRGRGLAVGLKSGPTTGLSYSTVRLLADGSVVVHAGTSDMGQGARTIFAQIAAEELGAPIEWITVVMGDTAVVPYDQQTSASRSSVLMGNSVLSACRDVQAKLRTMAARLEGVEEDAIDVSRGEVRFGDRVLPIRDVLVRGLGRLGGEVIGIGESRKEADPDHPLGGTAAFYEFNCTAVEVEVDRATGDILVTRFVSRVRRRQGPQPGAGPWPGRRRRGDGARPHADGALHLRRGRPDPEPRRDRLPHPDEHGPAARDGERPHRKRGWARPVRLEGDERGRAPAGCAGGCRGRSRRDGRRHPRPAPDAGTGLGRAPGTDDAMTYTFTLDEPHDLTLSQVTALVGGKAANLGVMSRELGLPVPPGFAITTDTCRAFLAGGWPAGLDEELRVRMAHVEAAVGRRFGDGSDPLLVSVRSGAPVSMPGMMDTILNLGLNEATTSGLARASGSDALARDCRERFDASFRAIVGVGAVPDDPWLQLRQAIAAVFRSWNSDRAKAYRREEGIADDLGTAVTVQAMVFGNRGASSATGVLFTRNPSTGEPTLFGDVLFDAQGEDVVAGTHQTEPITVLDQRLPAVAAELRDHAMRLERRYADLCDIEFTIEDGKLWMLQVRVGKRSPQAALRIAVDIAEDETFPVSRALAVERVATLLADPPTRSTSRTSSVRPLVTGLPASPGMASGPIVTSPEAAQEAAEGGRPAILVRAETSPDDVHGMAVAAGILTSRGGLASHAAVVARGWGIPAVVGAAGIEVRDGLVIVGERTLTAGDVITIDGSSGEVFEGAIPGTAEIVPEAQTLLSWARELGITIGDDGVDAAPAAAPTEAGNVTPADCLQAIAIKGFVPIQGVADAVLSTPEDLQPIVDQLAAEGLVTAVAGAYRLTDAGKARSAELLAAEQAAWGIDQAVAALDGFLDLDHRMKETVTAWQLRDAEGQVVNDHADADYDRGVLARLDALHADASAWLTPNETGCPRLATYRVRLDRALEQALGGDQRYVASPRVDSYHGIWFELHEDLIQLAGRTREEEAAAGRA